MSKHKISNKSISSAVLNYIACCFVLFVVLPITTYYFNEEYIPWRCLSWLLWFSSAVLVGLPFIWSSIRFCPKCWKLAESFLISGCLYLLFRTFFLPIDFGVLNGKAIFEVPFFSDSTLLSSLLIYLFIYGLTLYRRKLMETLMKIGALGAFFLCCFIFFSALNTIREQQLNHEIKKFNRFSTTENIIVISMDAVQGNFLRDIFEKNPDLMKIFDGFTWYPNVISYAPNTSFSLISTLAGKYLPAGKNGERIENLKEKYYPNYLPNNLDKLGYATDTFGKACLVGEKRFCETDETVLPESYTQPLSAYEIAILRTWPKSFSWKMINSMLPKNTSTNEVDIINNDKEGYGLGLDLYAFRHLYQQAFLVKEPVFKFHHYLFTHPPIRFNAQCAYNVNASQNADSTKAEIICALSEFNKLLNKLKSLKVYNQSLIILTSDHGYPGLNQISANNRRDDLASFSLSSIDSDFSVSRYWPILLVKNINEKGELKIDKKSVELIDMAPTIYQAVNHGNLCDGRCDGQSLANTKNVSKNRERKVMFYTGGNQDLTDSWYTSTLFSAANVYGAPRMGVFNAMLKTALANQFLNCSKTILFNEKTPQIVFQGVSSVESWGRWSDGNSAILSFNINSTGCAKHQIKISVMGFVDNKHPTQQAEVLLNGVDIGQLLINSDQPHKEFVFSYPVSLMKENQVNKLEFRIEEPVLVGEGDAVRRIGVGFKSLTFE